MKLDVKNRVNNKLESMKLIFNGEERGDIIFKVLCGSHAHGTNIPESDEDYKGVYLQSPESILERGYQEQVEVSKDECYYELKRFVELCCTNNPTMLEVLFTPVDCIVYKHDVFDLILKDKEKFLSKSCKYSFGGYAQSQIQKASGLDKKMNWEKDKIERKDILDFCYILLGQEQSVKIREHFDISKDRFNEFKGYGLAKVNNFPDIYSMYHFPGNSGGICTEKSNDIQIRSVPKGYGFYKYLRFDRNGYSSHCKDYKQYQEWLANRNTQRYVDIESHNQKIDGKNLLHCIRLIEMSKEIAEGKGFNVRRPNAEYLISIRKGKVNLPELLGKATLLLKESDELYEKSDLPKKCDRGHFLSLLPKIRKQYYAENKITVNFES